MILRVILKNFLNRGSVNWSTHRSPAPSTFSIGRAAVPRRKISSLIQLASLVHGPPYFRRSMPAIYRTIHGLVVFRKLHLTAISSARRGSALLIEPFASVAVASSHVLHTPTSRKIKQCQLRPARAVQKDKPDRALCRCCPRDTAGILRPAAPFRLR